MASQPAVTLVRWSVIQGEGRHRYLVGYCIENAEGRVSSPIVSFDAARMHCLTASGRRYILEGPSGFDCDGNALWEWLAQSRGIRRWTVVTDTVVSIDTFGRPALA